MKIRKLDTNRRSDVLKFVRFPLHLYRHEDYYCPALESGEIAHLDRSRNEFYQHSFADFFLAESGNEMLGRVAAVYNTRHNEYRQVSTAFFSSFDTIADQQVAANLFDAVFDWACKHKRKTIIGPRGLVGSDAAGVLIEGFDQKALMGVPYNFPYYDHFINSMGFSRLTDHYSGFASARSLPPSRLIDIAERTEKRRGYRILSFKNKAEMKHWIPQALKVHERAFSNSHEWHPIDQAEAQRVVDGLMEFADPRFIKLALNGDEVIGFAICYPDISDGVRKARGKLFPLGWYHLQQAVKRSRCLIANGIGVLPSYQNLGVNAMLYASMFKEIYQCPRFDTIEVVQVNEKNFPSFSDMGTLGVKWTKIHRSYSRDL